MRIFSRILVFFGFTGRKFYPRADAAREIFFGRPVPARSQNISARPGPARGLLTSNTSTVSVNSFIHLLYTILDLQQKLLRHWKERKILV
jgi:hypothetical protein